MSFTPITTEEIAEGKPVRDTTQTKIKDNFEDHEYRLTQLHSRESLPPIILRVNGPYSLYGGTQSTVVRTEITKKLVITGARLMIDQAGSGGITEVNIRRIRSGVSQPIFDTLPSVDASEGDDSISTNAVLNDFRSVDDGDLLELDIESVQTNGKGFMVRLDVQRDEA